MRFTGERILSLCQAALNLVESYDQVERQVNSLRANLPDGMLHIDAIMEILGAHRPAISDITTIVREKSHFEVRQSGNLKSRLAMQRKRGSERIEPLLTAELGKLALNLDEPQSIRPEHKPSTPPKSHFDKISAQLGEGATIPLDFNLPSDAPLATYHELLRQTWGCIAIYRREVHDTIRAIRPDQTEEASLQLIEDLLDNNFLSEAALSRVFINDL